MNLADTCFAEGNRIRLRDVPYCAQLLALVLQWQSVAWSAPRIERRPAPRLPQHSGSVRGFRRGSIPHQVMKQLFEHSPHKMTNVQLCVLLPGLPRKPIAVALYELTHKGLLESEGGHNALRYGVTRKGRALAAAFDES